MRNAPTMVGGANNMLIYTECCGILYTTGLCSRFVHNMHRMLPRTIVGYEVVYKHCAECSRYSEGGKYYTNI